MSTLLAEPDSHQTARRPTALEVTAAGLLAASVVLHLVAMVPHYYGGAGQTSLWSEPDQAAEYAVLAAGWALALGIALTGPARARMAAAVAVGVAATEFGLRLSDVGEVIRYGTGEASAGLWLMTAAWVVGAAGAGLAVVAVRRRDRLASGSRSDSSAVPGDGGRESFTTPPDAGAWDAPAGPVHDAGPDSLASTDRLAAGSEPSALSSSTGPDSALPPFEGQAASTVPLPVRPESSTVPLPVRPESTVPLPIARESSSPSDSGWEQSTLALPMPEATPSVGSGSNLSEPLGAGPAILIMLLALATAGAFLPAWDHYAGTAATTGRSVSFTLGNAFSGPWQVVLGNVFVALALVAVPLYAVRMRDRAAGAALIAGSLIVLASQFTAAIVQVDHHVPPAVAGLTPAQANQLGLQLHMSLTGWFTFDVLAAFALFVTAMVLGHVRDVAVPSTSIRQWPSAPQAGPPAPLPWS
jgi:hypothetical protein